MMDQRTASRLEADLLPETTRNYRPKTGKELATAANIIDLYAFLLMNSATARYGIPGLHTTSGSNYMPKSGGQGQSQTFHRPDPGEHR